MLCVLLFGMPVLAALLTHRWWLAVECAGIGWLVYWGVPRLLRLAISGTVTGTRWAGRWSLRTVQRWWKGLVMVLALGRRIGFEERLLEERFGGEFLAYRARVGGFLPRVGTARAPRGRA